jgi:hypothetical protein
MTTLKSTIENLATEFALSIIGALRSASIDELTAVAGSSGGGVRRVGRPAIADGGGAAVAVGRGRRGRGGRLPRRSPSDIGKLLESIVGLLQQHPEGLRSEQIRAQLNLRKNELPRPLGDGLAAGRLSKKGEKRATTYYASGGSKGGAKAEAAPKRRGRKAKR